MWHVVLASGHPLSRLGRESSLFRNSQVYAGVDKRPFALTHSIQLRRAYVKSLQGEMSVVKLRFALLDQFFASSISSLISVSSPESFWTSSINREYSPTYSMAVRTFSGPRTPQAF